MTKSLPYTNYIFDLYGTLIDIRTDEQDLMTWRKWQKWLDEKNILHPASPEEMRDEFFAMDRAARDKALASGVFEVPEIDVIPIYRELFAKYGNDMEMLDEGLLNEAGYAFRTASREYMRLFDGVAEFLHLIRESGSRAYILSNAQRSYTWPEICYFDLQNMVEGVLISSDMGCMKPDRHFFDIMIDKYSLDKSRTVMIGDSYENDYRGALGAELNAIWLGPDNPAGRFYREQVS